MGKNANGVNVIIYNSSSFGGCYDYALALMPAYQANEAVSNCTLLLPVNASVKGPHIVRNIPADVAGRAGSLRAKMQFLWRTIAAPLNLLFYLMRQKPSLVVFNDFEQLSAPLWAPLYRLLLGKHTLAIILHDPDRDGYPIGGPAYSRFCMKQVMGVMRIAMYHEWLPERPYYAQRKRTLYLNIPHGLYVAAAPDVDTMQYLAEQKLPGHLYISILGNIRAEKNYHLAIEALAQIPGLQLVIAGKPSSGGVNVQEYLALAEKLGVANRIVKLEKFLTDAEMGAVIAASDMVLLYYSRTFTSQSGILNLIAPFKKPILASAGESSLANTVKRFNLGLLVAPDNKEALISGLQNYLAGTGKSEPRWADFFAYASWKNNAEITLDAWKQVKKRR